MIMIILIYTQHTTTIVFNIFYIMQQQPYFFVAITQL